MRGKAIPLSAARHLVGDLLHFARQIPTIPVQRHMNLAPLVAARHQVPLRPNWTSIFTRAYALVAAEFPELRRAFVKFPWPQLYEYPESVASIAVERMYQGEPVVFFARIRNPATIPLDQLDQLIRWYNEAPLEEIREFQGALKITRWPWSVRRPLWWLALNLGRHRPKFFGTFGVTVYSGLGSESLHPLTPMTTTLNYGVLTPDGTLPVRVVYDHRVMDGATVARVLARLESVLCENLLADLRALAGAKPRLDEGIHFPGGSDPHAWPVAAVKRYRANAASPETL